MFRYNQTNKKSSDSEVDKLDKSLLEEHGYKYMSWLLKVDFELLNSPKKLEDWDFDFSFSRYSGRVHDLVGHYEIETRKDEGFLEGYTHFDYIHFPENEIVLQLRLNEDKGSDNNYGLVERRIVIPEQTLDFYNLEAGRWRNGEVQPLELLLKVDIDKKKYTWDKSNQSGFGIAYWESWTELVHLGR